MASGASVLRESKVDTKGREVENRVILTPPLLRELVSRCGNTEFFVEKGAGEKLEFSDSAYQGVGAKLVSRQEALSKDVIMGVKEPRLADLKLLRNNLWVSYLHFAQSKPRTESALHTSREKGTVFLGLETMERQKEGAPFFPCLAPMSEAAAKVIARHADEYALLKKKIITSGLPETGLKGVKAVILGGGSVGKTAAEEFSERGCEVVLLEKISSRTRTLAQYFREHQIRYPKVTVLPINPENLRASVRGAFFLVSAMYSSGKKPPKLATVDLPNIAQQEHAVAEEG